MTYAFSDGNIFYEYAVFVVLVAAGALFTLSKTYSGRSNAVARKIVNFTRSRGVFREKDITTDLRILDMARIAIGSIATLRYGEIFLLSLPSRDVLNTVLSGAAMLLALAVVVGFMTLVATIILMSFGNLIVDNILQASTLGTMVMSIALLLLLLAPAGRTLSIDAWLATRAGRAERFASGLYRLSGPTSADRIILAKLAALFAYFCVCLYSVSWHLNDEAWTSGNIVAWVLLSPYFTPEFYTTAWEIYAVYPHLYVWFSYTSIAGMVVWYVLVLPGLFMGRWLRWFVIFWGLGFFLISTLILSLRYLGWYELVLWFALFVTMPAFSNSKDATYTAGMPQGEVSPPSQNRFGTLVMAVGFALTVLSLAFLIRLPIVDVRSDTSILAKWSRQAFGSAPLAFGIHKINVFNSEDLSVFRFSRRLYAYDSQNSSPKFETQGDLETQLNFKPGDAQYYALLAQKRRVSRVELACDRAFFEASIPIMKSVYFDRNGEIPVQDYIYERRVHAWPKASDFDAGKAVQHASYPLCRARLNLRDGVLKDLVFVQAGVDEMLRQKDVSTRINADYAIQLSNYPCRYDGFFLGTIAVSHPSLKTDPALAKAIAKQKLSEYGKFPLTCFLDGVALVKAWPELLESKNAPASGDTCNTGIRFLDQLSIAHGNDEIGTEILAASIARANAAFTLTDFNQCREFVIGAFKSYLERVTTNKSLFRDGFSYTPFTR